MEILRRLEGRGYPADYLFSRIRGKRASLIKDWSSLLLEVSPREHLASLPRYAKTEATPEGVWRRLLLEFRWVYSAMDQLLRERLSPFFAYAELRTIFICLRFIERKDLAKVQELLSASLLSERVQGILTGSSHAASAIDRLGYRFLSISKVFGRLRKIFDEKGLQGFEEHLTDRYLEYSVTSKIDGTVRDLFLRIIDARNLLTLEKYLRFKGASPPPFIRGGRIGRTGFEEILEKGDRQALDSLARRLTGVETSEIMEHSLYRWITGILRKAGREPLSTALVLDYLWRSSMEARNLSILLYGGEIDRDAVASEMIL